MNEQPRRRNVWDEQKLLIIDVTQRIFLAPKVRYILALGANPMFLKLSRNKAPKVRYKSGDVSHVAPSELLFIPHSISIGLSPYVNIYRTFGAAA